MDIHIIFVKVMSEKYLLLIITILIVVLLVYFLNKNKQSETFNNKDDKPKLILYYSTHCIWCQKLHPEWEKIKGMRLNIEMEEVNCEQNGSKCSGLNGVPTIILIKNNNRITYEGNRQADDIVKFVNSN